MELALSLGDTSKPFKFLEKTPLLSSSTTTNSNKQQELGLCMASSINNNTAVVEKERRLMSSSSIDSVPIQLDLLPFSPVPRGHNINGSSNNNPSSSSSSQFRFPWLAHNFVNNVTGTADGGSDTVSSPNSAASSFQMEFGINGRRINQKRDHNNAELVSENERGSSRASDDEENGSTRKKLRLSKEQSAFLEESFKEHNTLNPKQKLALANQLNLRPRQVEVWFQNRRARTKLKQTEVDCEYLKRCCETLTEENRRLQKEVQELRALKTSQPFFMQLPATTLTMCPSCERVSTSAAATTTTTTTATPKDAAKGLLSLSPNKTTNNLFPSKGQDQNHQSTSN